jgi:hypothetical protein
MVESCTEVVGKKKLSEPYPPFNYKKLLPPHSDQKDCESAVLYFFCFFLLTMEITSKWHHVKSYLLNLKEANKHSFTQQQREPACIDRRRIRGQR